MCDEPVMRTPANGFGGAYFSRMAINPGISFSAIEISFLPNSAREMSATLKSAFCFRSAAVFIKGFRIQDSEVRRRVRLGFFTMRLPTARESPCNIFEISLELLTRRLKSDFVRKSSLREM